MANVLAQIVRSTLAFVAAVLAWGVVSVVSISALSGYLLDEYGDVLGRSGQFAIVTIFAIAALAGGYVVALIGRRAKLRHAGAFAVLVLIDALLTDPFTSKYVFTGVQAVLIAGFALTGGIFCVRVEKWRRTGNNAPKTDLLTVEKSPYTQPPG